MRAPLWTTALAAMVMAGPAGSVEPEGGGAWPAILEQDPTLPAHVVYRPADLDALGDEKLGVYVFGNGGCSADATSSREHLLAIASHGYLAVAPGSIPRPGAPTPAPTPRPSGKLPAETQPGALTEAIDWALRENARPGSRYFGRIAVDQIAVSGWSCGGLQALLVADDPRIKTVIVMNSGVYNSGQSRIEGLEVDKSLVTRLHGSALYVLGGPTDSAYPNGMDDFRRITGIPAAVVNIPVGHGGTYREPNGGLGAEVVTAWLDWKLKGRSTAAARFTGPNCGFCTDSCLTIERKNLD